MSKIFKQVYVKDRLPEKDGIYWVKWKLIDSALYPASYKKELGGFGCNGELEWWLEEVGDKVLKKFKIKYFYLATGMEGRADTYPQKIIEAESRDHAIYLYNKMRGLTEDTFERYMNLTPEYHRMWGLTVKEV